MRSGDATGTMRQGRAFRAAVARELPTMQAAPPPVAAQPAQLPPGRVDCQCGDGRRVLVLYRARETVVRIERHEPLVLTPAGLNAWRSDAYAGGPTLLMREPSGVRLVTPGWPDTRCTP